MSDEVSHRDTKRHQYPFLKKRRLGRMLVTFEGKVIETCGFHRWIDDITALKSM
jgi:hypothetical protein